MLYVGREMRLLDNIDKWLTFVLSIVKRAVGIGKTSARMDFFQCLIGSAICGGYQTDTAQAVASTGDRATDGFSWLCSMVVKYHGFRHV